MAKDVVELIDVLRASAEKLSSELAKENLIRHWDQIIIYGCFAKLADEMSKEIRRCGGMHDV